MISTAGTPTLESFLIILMADTVSLSLIESVNSKYKSWEMSPRAFTTFSYSTESPQKAITWSIKLNASLILPSAFREMALSDSLS